TRTCKSGTRRLAWSCASTKATPASWSACPSFPKASTSPPRAATAPCASGERRADLWNSITRKGLCAARCSTCQEVKELREDVPLEPTTSSVPPMSEVTRILSAIEQGEPHAAGQLLPLVYDELRQLAAQKLAQEKPGQTLQATALVHEAYARLVDVDKPQH